MEMQLVRLEWATENEAIKEASIVILCESALKNNLFPDKNRRK